MRIKWLHLSDIHFTYENYNSEILRQDFIQRIRDLSSSEQFTHLFITGDILNTNSEPGPDTVGFIRNLVDTMKLDSNHVIIVPGNHDHDRDITSRLASSIYGSEPPQKRLQKIDAINYDEMNGLLESFDKFSNVYSKIFGHKYYDEKINPHNFFEFDQYNIIGLNTAWLERSSGEEGTLYIGTKQLSKLLQIHQESLKSKRINIAVGHHALADLEIQERNRLLDLFQRYNIGIYLCGHRHIPSITYFKESDVLELLCPGGFVDNTEYSEGGYIWGIMDTDSDFYKAEVYNWNHGHWSIESKLPGTDERGIYYFNTQKYKHNSDIVAVDFKLFGPHIPFQALRQALECDNFDIHVYHGDDKRIDTCDKNSIDDLVQDINFYIEHNKSVHIFPIAPIPTLITLGFKLQKNSAIFVHQYDREKNRWVSNEETNDIRALVDSYISHKEKLILSISTSFVISDNQIEPICHFDECDYIKVKTTQIYPGYPLYATDIETVITDIFKELNIIAQNYKEIHVFAAVPAGFAIALGRNMLKSVYSNVYLYNLVDHQYKLSNVLNPLKKAEPNTNFIFIGSFKNKSVSLPMLGRIVCGNITEASVEDYQYYQVPGEILGTGDYYIIQATGDSMIDAGIEDGDYIVIREQSTAEDGQIVVARVGSETTLKKLYHDAVHNKIILHPENIRYKDQIYDNIEIQGIAVRVIKEL